MRLANVVLASFLSLGADEGMQCQINPTCTIALTTELPFTPPEPGIWLSYTLEGECGFHWRGNWSVSGAETWWVYRRPWNALCGPSCAEVGSKGQYLHIPAGQSGTIKIEVTSDSGGGWAAMCVVVP